MMPVIRISDTTFERLQKWAKPLVDSADDALGKILDVAEGKLDRLTPVQQLLDTPIETSRIPDTALKEESKDLEPDTTKSGHSVERQRLSTGQKVSNEAYMFPILEAVYELGGKGRMNKVLEIVEHKMRHLFSDVDYQLMPSGGDIRWRNTAQWARNTLVHQRGLLKKNAGYGIWALTEQGIAQVESKPESTEGMTLQQWNGR